MNITYRMNFLYSTELIPKWSATSDNVITFQYKKKEGGSVNELKMRAPTKEAADAILDALDHQVAEIVVFRGMAPDMPAAIDMLKRSRTVSSVELG